SVIRDPGINTSLYMLDGRDLEGDPDAPRIDGTPVRLFHFASLLDGKRIGNEEYGGGHHQPLVAGLPSGYRDLRREAGWDAGAPYGWERLPSGEPMTRDMRRRYREAILGAEATGDREPPDPFDAVDPAAFTDWWNDLRATEAAGDCDGEIVFG